MAGPLGSSLAGKVILLVSVAQDMGYELGAPLIKRGCRVVVAGKLSRLQSTTSVNDLGSAEVSRPLVVFPFAVCACSCGGSLTV